MMDELEHPLTLAELAAAVDGHVEGDGTLPVRRAVHVADARAATDLAIAMGPAFIALLADSPARLAIVLADAVLPANTIAAIRVKRMQSAMAALTTLFDRPRWHHIGIHPSATVDPAAIVAPDASIGPGCVIGPRARIGAGAILFAQVTIGAGATVEQSCQLHAGVRIGDGCTIGARTIVHPNAVIGADGFSFVPPGRGAVEAAKAGANQVGQEQKDLQGARYLRIASLGPVIVGADCEIGACTTIDRATLRATRIGDGTKIDNLVQIGHNDVIGEDVLICGQVGLAGSVTVGDRAVLGGRSGVADQIKVGAGAIVAAASGVGTNVPPGAVFMGYPAQSREREVSQMMATRRLPRLLGRLEALEARLAALEAIEPKTEND